MARATQPVSIDGIEFDALIDLSETWESDVPQYPTESGYVISDSIILRPLTLSMTLYLSNTPVTWRERHGSNTSRVLDVTKQLEELYFQKTPVTVITNDKTYRNMAIVSIELTKTKETGPSREIPITFQEIRITESMTTTIPDSYGKSGATGANAGMANTTAGDTQGSPSGEGGSKSSIAYGIANGSGLFGR